MTNAEMTSPVVSDRLRSADSPRAAGSSMEAERSVAPGALLARVRTSFAGAGITRVAEVTGLDVIGIPVAVAVRPNSRSLSVSQGKGMSRDQAIASAIMEALELAAAERYPVAAVEASLSEVEAGDSDRIDLGLSTRCRLDRLGRDDRLLWTAGHDLASGREVRVPWPLVGIDYRDNPPGFHRAFQISTDGLASGLTVDDAVLHGLCELIERDATALLEFATTEELARRVYAIDDTDGSDVLRMKAMIEAAGCRLTVLDMTTDIGVPAFNAIISDLGETSATTLYAHSGGSGCHPQPVVALKKAIVEAAQSRITRITGSRDDLPATTYRAAEGRDRTAITGMLAFADRAPEARAKPSSAEAVSGSPAENIQALVRRLGRLGIQQVVAVLIANDLGIEVVRVIVPGLQTEITGSSSKLGRRALLKLVGRLQ